MTATDWRFTNPFFWETGAPTALLKARPAPGQLHRALELQNQLPASACTYRQRHTCRGRTARGGQAAVPRTGGDTCQRTRRVAGSGRQPAEPLRALFQQVLPRRRPAPRRAAASLSCEVPHLPWLDLQAAGANTALALWQRAHVPLQPLSGLPPGRVRVAEALRMADVPAGMPSR